jgi:hypothetical protein
MPSDALFPGEHDPCVASHNLGIVKDWSQLTFPTIRLMPFTSLFVSLISGVCRGFRTITQCRGNLLGHLHDPGAQFLKHAGRETL